MAEDLNALIAKLKSFRDKLPEVLPGLATVVSLSGKAIAERAIKDHGFGEQYSNKEVPAFWLYGKNINARGSSFVVDQERKGSGVTWGEFRAAQGLQNKYVDLTYSGKMWAGMFPQEVQVDLFKYTAPLGNNTVEGQNKMNWNHARYGDFIGEVLTGDNLEDLKRVAYDELTQIMDRELGEFRV